MGNPLGGWGTWSAGLLLVLARARSRMPVVPVPVVPLPVVQGVVRALVVRSARGAERDSVRRVVPISARGAGCGCVGVWLAHAARERATDASRPTRPSSRRALRDEIGAILACGFVPAVIPIQTARG